jgi:hypothetical protein
VIDPSADYNPGSADSDAYIRGKSSSYSSTRSKSSSFATNYLFAGQRHSDADSKYYVWRGYLRFDTSGLDDGVTVTDVTLTLAVATDQSQNDFDVQIIEDAWDYPLSAGNRESNYDDVLAAALAAVWRNTSGMSTSTNYTSPSLTTSYVSLTGDTKYALRSSRTRIRLRLVRMITSASRSMTTMLANRATIPS